MLDSGGGNAAEKKRHSLMHVQVLFDSGRLRYESCCPSLEEPLLLPGNEMDAQLPSLEPAPEEGNNRPILESTLQSMTLSSEETSYPGEELRTDSSIRLLRIHGASGREQEIKCTLQPFDLKDEPCYCALSYTWGAPVRSFDSQDEALPNEVRSILCNGQALSVTPNLEDALAELRQSGFIDWLWVDSISINQSNLIERASQVALMARIYHSANETIAWLGKDETGAEDLQWGIDVMVPEMVRRGSKYWETRCLSDAELPLIFGVDDIPGKVLRIETFIATHHLLHRAWVAQEVALSRAIHVRCGRWRFQWADFQNVYKSLVKARWFLEKVSARSPDTHELFKRAGAMLLLICATRACVAFERPDTQEVLLPARMMILTIMDLEDEYGMRTDMEKAAAWLGDSLSKIRLLQSSELHDKIYSALGIASHFADRVFQLIRPDYGRSAEEVYTSATANIIMNCQHLGILAHVGDIARNRSLNLPSWVVDYSQLSDTSRICGFGRHILFSLDESVASRLPPPLREIQGVRLTLEGTDLDHVDVVSLAMWDEVLADPGHHFTGFCDFLSYLPCYHLNSWTPTEALWRLLMFDTESIGHRISLAARSSYSQAFLRVIAELFEWWYEVSGYTLETLDTMENAAIVALRRFLGGTEWQAIQDLVRHCTYAQVKHFLDSVSPKVYNRRLFKTKGDIIGMGSRSTQAGDQVWFVRDCRTPLILRPKPETKDFWLVGEAYLQGFMHGEKLKDSWKVAERLRPVTIV
ncbi:hypothetical protein GJ744_004017 [Endocarpon pusillum]|uniref:Heterokaryon incompatibility domain-containing protein n=1 Tax=Endocarpon pusillum TaxID=364733 RepID=A0A8H7A616_9EURO|nr:hypothetical protein GJ744_004017 [Endocarpon pusillum]